MTKVCAPNYKEPKPLTSKNKFNFLNIFFHIFFSPFNFTIPICLAEKNVKNIKLRPTNAKSVYAKIATKRKIVNLAFLYQSMDRASALKGLPLSYFINHQMKKNLNFGKRTHYSFDREGDTYSAA
jgi:hypothetical protein